MRISDLVERLQAEGLLVDFSPGKTDVFDRAVSDSREIGIQSCFVAIKGHEADGHLFIDMAVKNGAVAIVCDAPLTFSREGLAGAALVHVSNSRIALLRLASMQAGSPADRMTLVGTTGTNGKTTVSTLVQRVLEQSGTPCGIIGTTGYAYGSTVYAARETTPSPLRIYALLAEMEEAGYPSCSMEVSSHALDQWRVDCSDFNVAVFTNLTRDHLDYHQTDEQYFQTKKRLFDGLPSNSTAVVNVDDPAGRTIVRDTNAEIITFGTQAPADVQFSVERVDGSGIRLMLDGCQVECGLSGHFNGSNIAAAYAAGIGLQIAPDRILGALASAGPVRGRFEVIQGSLGRTIIVDYAHTPDALDNVLRAARRIIADEATLWCVFGCGGDRDAGKRPIMGGIVERLADRVIVTSDNPRTEPSEKILDDIKAGMTRPEQADFEPNRRTAIAFAAAESRPGDLILIAGKGHETVQVIGAEAAHFDDREEATAAFGVSTKTSVKP